MKWPLEISTIPISVGAPGITLNVFILTIYLRDWYKGKRPTARDLILSSMTFTNIFFQCIMISNGLIYNLQSHTMIPKGVYLFEFLIVFFLADTCFWQTALLSIYYCIRLLNFPFSVFQWVKKMISTSTNLLLLGSAIFCFVISLPIIWTVHLVSPGNVTGPIRDIEHNLAFNNLFNFCNIVFGCVLPFTLTFTCIALSVGTLLKHVWSIRRNADRDSSPPQMAGLVRAAGTMVFCALLDLLFCGDVVGQVLSKFNSGDVVNTIIWVIITSYPTARSIVLIIGNPQLQKQLGGMCVRS